MPGCCSIYRSDLLAGQVIVVTDGGSGIGRRTAHELASLGAAVVSVGRRLEKLAAVQDEFASAGGSCSIHACDIREEETVRQTIAGVLARHGRIDGLVNNARGQFPAPLASISAKGWDAVVRNNLTGGFLMARERVVQWTGDRDGAIVNIIADIWGGMPGMGHSGAARAGNLNFTETAALEWAPVRVNAVAPGWIASSGMHAYPPAMRDTIRDMHKPVLLRRLGTESEVAEAIMFLLSPAAFISGACLRVDVAAPNAKRIWPEVGTGGSTSAFDGFHSVRTPQVLQGD